MVDNVSYQYCVARQIYLGVPRATGGSLTTKKKNLCQKIDPANSVLCLKQMQAITNVQNLFDFKQFFVIF